jgi:G3E family GTPase
MKFAVIENEFGEIGVDDKIIPEAVDEEVIEVMNGCICCTVRGDLVEALKRLHKRVDKFDGVIIETTGLADPAPVVQTFFVDEGKKCIFSV